MFSILSCYTMCFLYSFSFFKGRVLHFFILEYDQFLYFLWPTDHIKNSHILPLTLKLYCKPNFNLCRYVQPPLQLDSTPIPNNSPRIPKADLEKVFDKNWQLLTDIEHRKNIFFWNIYYQYLDANTRSLHGGSIICRVSCCLLSNCHCHHRHLFPENSNRKRKQSLSQNYFHIPNARTMLFCSWNFPNVSLPPIPISHITIVQGDVGPVGVQR